VRGIEPRAQRPGARRHAHQLGKAARPADAHHADRPGVAGIVLGADLERHHAGGGDTLADPPARHARTHRIDDAGAVDARNERQLDAGLHRLAGPHGDIEHPVDGRGLDADADLNMAEAIALNAKVQRPAVCNAMETLLVDKGIAGQFLPAIARRLGAKKVELRCDEFSFAILKASAQTADLLLRPVTDQDFFTEYNDYILNVRLVDGVQQAVDHINHYGSSHSDSIVTRNEATARRFLSEVDSAAVYWNASTRFTDGGEFGMGAEIGISTDKIGARGPMGLEELTSYKWLGLGNGQLRT